MQLWHAVCFHSGRRTKNKLIEVTIMAVSKKSIVKPSTAKQPAKAQSTRSVKNPATPAGNMVTAMRAAKAHVLARNIF